MLRPPLLRCAPLQRLENKEGFQTTAKLDWTVGQVGEWLAKEGVASLQPDFAQQDIDGEALLTITRDDLGYFGVHHSAGADKMMKIIGALQAKSA